MRFGLQERLVYDSVDRASKPLRILIADDRSGTSPLCEMLSGRPTLQVVGEAATGVVHGAMPHDCLLTLQGHSADVPFLEAF